MGGHNDIKPIYLVVQVPYRRLARDKIAKRYSCCGKLASHVYLCGQISICIVTPYVEYIYDRSMLPVEQINEQRSATLVLHVKFLFKFAISKLHCCIGGGGTVSRQKSWSNSEDRDISTVEFTCINIVLELVPTVGTRSSSSSLFYALSHACLTNNFVEEYQMHEHKLLGNDIVAFS